VANQVYANGREVSCKAADGKSICAFPDVCLTPPPPPAGYLPIPYPNTGMASDATNGSTTVQISGKEVMLKNKSFFKKSTGDEAATRSTPMGVITHTITGKVYFNSWSMDVKVEGENVVRHLDLTTHNHMSFPGDTPTWPYIDATALAPDHPCVEDQLNEMHACQDFQPYGDQDVCTQLGRGKPAQAESSFEAPQMATIAAADDCLAARRCALQPYKPNGCCQPQTPHHLIEASAVAEKSPHGLKVADVVLISPIHDYDYTKAPCVCAEGTSQHVGTHGEIHARQKAGVLKGIEEGTIVQGSLPLADGRTLNNVDVTNYGDAKKNGIAAVKKTFQESKCNEDCLNAQLDNYHNQCGMNDSTPIKAVQEGSDDMGAIDERTVDRTHSAHLARRAMGRG
jgi:Domain of unknown function (DUF4150)/GHH signature containing HNH/Endo VII superfamily nuclease toxin  2